MFTNWKPDTWTMSPIRLRRRNVALVAIILCVLYLFCLLLGISPTETVGDLVYKDDSYTKCNTKVKWKTGGSTSFIALLGAEGSGVEWLRFFIEQTSGTYTGSPNKDHAAYFKGDGITDNKKVLLVASHSVNKVPQLDKAIVLYRSMKDSVRSHYTRLYGSHLPIEGTVNSYKTDRWTSFAKLKSRVWADNYRLYLGSKKPLLLVDYEDLITLSGLQEQMGKISDFLGVRLSEEMLECLTEHNDFPLKPKALREGFQPYNLLPRKEVENLESLAQHVDNQIEKYTRDKNR